MAKLEQNVKAYIKGCEICLASKVVHFILVIANWLIMMVHYELIEVTINAFTLAKVIFDIVIPTY